MHYEVWTLHRECQNGYANWPRAHAYENAKCIWGCRGMEIDHVARTIRPLIRRRKTREKRRYLPGTVFPCLAYGAHPFESRHGGHFLIKVFLIKEKRVCRSWRTEKSPLTKMSYVGQISSFCRHDATAGIIALLSEVPPLPVRWLLMKMAIPN